MTVIGQLGFKQPTKVQEQVFPSALKKQNVIGVSETGSGKSHAFLLPIFNNLNLRQEKVQALVVSPSRELAEQLYQMAQKINQFLPQPAKIQLLIGGKDLSQLQEKIKNKQPQIIIGTPGRIVKLLPEIRAKMADLMTLVIDEADMALDLGNATDLQVIIESMPQRTQIMFFSATINQQLQTIIKKYLHGAVIIKQTSPHQTINQNVVNYLIEPRALSNEELIYRLITRQSEYLVFIFANTKKRVEEIYRFLQNKGLNVAQMHGDLPSRRRHQIMKRILHLDFEYVVTTDLAARGIDIPGISLVVNDDIPNNLEYFIHRVGRTARMGHQGLAITIINRHHPKVQKLQEKGIKFQEVRLSQGQLVKITSRKRRQDRQHQYWQNQQNQVVIPQRLQKIKPGYKNRIKAFNKRQLQKKRRR